MTAAPAVEVDRFVPHRRVLVVGEVNPLSCDPHDALVPWPIGCAGERLQAKVFSLPEDDYLALQRTNLCTGRWRVPAARQRALELTYASSPDSILRPDVIVMLGRKMAAAFGYGAAPYTHGTRFGATPNHWPRDRRVPIYELVSIPHPRGLNRRWHQPGSFERVRELMREVAPDVPWGTL